MRFWRGWELFILLLGLLQVSSVPKLVLYIVNGLLKQRQVVNLGLLTRTEYFKECLDYHANRLILIIQLDLRVQSFLYPLHLFDKHTVDDDLIVLFLLEVLDLFDVPIMDLRNVSVHLVDVILKVSIIASEVLLTIHTMLVDEHTDLVFHTRYPLLDIG